MVFSSQHKKMGNQAEKMLTKGLGMNDVQEVLGADTDLVKKCLLFSRVNRAITVKKTKIKGEYLVKSENGGLFMKAKSSQLVRDAVANELMAIAEDLATDSIPVILHKFYLDKGV